MEKIWNEMHSAAMKVINPRAVSRIVEAGGVCRRNNIYDLSCNILLR